MSDIAIKVENLSKQYRLGTVGTGTLSHDLNRFWAKVRGKEDPYLQVGQVNDRTTKAESDYVWALQDINFEVKKGEILGIIGKNGAGKSTLLKILSRVTSPTTGSIKMNGRVGSLLEVGTGFHPELTGRENIFLNGAILGMRKWEIQKKLDEIVDFSGCEKYLDTPVKRYSSGMKVRLGFAVAAHLEPEILIVDEVLAVGDAEFQAKATTKIFELVKNKKMTVIFVSHNFSLIKKICSRCIVLGQGKIQFVGDSDFAVDKHEDYEDSYFFSSSVKPIGDEPDFIKFFYVSCSLRGKSVLRLINSSTVFFNLEFKDEVRIEDYNIGIGILGPNDEFKSVLNTKMRGLKSSVKSKYLSCQVDQFPLMKGQYYLSCTIMKDNLLIVQLRNFLKIIVDDGDFYNSGVSNNYGRSGIYINHEWKVL